MDFQSDLVTSLVAVVGAVAAAVVVVAAAVELFVLLLRTVEVEDVPSNAILPHFPNPSIGLHQHFCPLVALRQEDYREGVLVRHRHWVPLPDRRPKPFPSNAVPNRLKINP